MKQYEIWWARLPEPSGRRPVLLISRDAAYEHLDRVLVVPITRVIRNIPQDLPIGRVDGMSKPSAATFDNLHLADVSWLDRRIGELFRPKIVHAKRALGAALAWTELTRLAV